MGTPGGDRMKPLYINSKFVQRLAKALGVEENWRRIVLDIRFDDVALVYIESIPDAEKLDEIDIRAGIDFEGPHD